MPGEDDDAAAATAAALVDNIKAAGTAAAASIAAVGVKLPSFWLQDPHFWFSQAEAQFNISGITVEQTRFQHVLRSLDSSTANQVLSKIKTPRAGQEYSDLKAALIKAFAKTEQDRAAQLFNMGGLGSKTPTFLLNEMKALMGDEPCGLLFKHLFLSNLPEDIRLVLVQHTDPIEDLAEMADKMWKEKSTASLPLSITAVKGRTPSKPSAPSSGSTTSTCWYHRTFGSEARSCTSPCTFSKQGNASTSQ